MSILLETYRQSLTYKLVNPESAPLVELSKKLSKEDSDLLAEEWMRLDSLCREEKIPLDGKAYEQFEPVIVEEFTAKYGRS